MIVRVKGIYSLFQENSGSSAGKHQRPGEMEEVEVEMADVIRQRRSELGLSQSELARLAGIDGRQIRRYEAGDSHPSLPAAVKIAQILGITTDELAGLDEPHRIDLSGDWWASWQTSKDFEEVITAQEVRVTQTGDDLKIRTTTRGIAVEDGGYHWNGEFALWGNEVLLGWYTANDGAVRSKGTFYFTVHPHGAYLLGRWVGMSYDGKIRTGWGAIGKSEEEARNLIQKLKVENAEDDPNQ